MSGEKEETLFFILFGIFLSGVMVLLIFLQCWENDFKTDRQICEENNGIFIENHGKAGSSCIYSKENNND